MKIKGLVISYFFPPINSSEGNVTFKLLNSSIFSYDIFSQKKETFWSYGKNNFLSNKKIKILDNNAFNLSSFEKIGKHYFDKKKFNYNFIMSRSMPVESHKIALKIKIKKPSILWIASFGDPIANNPYEILAYTFKKNNFTFKKFYGFFYLIKKIKIIFKYLITKYIYIIKNKILINIQNKIFQKANVLIFNNKQQAKYMLSNNYCKYKNKILILSHSYSENLFESEYNKLLKIKQHINRKLIKILYTGHTDNIRTLKYFLYACCEKKDILKNKIIFTIFGNMPQNEINYIKEMKLDDIVIFKNQINYEESLQIMKNSDLLIHVDAIFPSELIKENIFFAAKLSDYLGSGTKILGLTTQGISKKILEDHGHYCIDNNKTIILNFLYDLINNQIDLSKNNNLPKEYSSKNIAKLFDYRIKEEIKNEINNKKN